MGYTPVFDSVFSGTLCGKWPDTGLWVCLLAMADRNGVVDKTPEYISRVVGIPVVELMACLDRFMAPDPYSRTSEYEGRRLVRVDEGRPWGWRIVNHAYYRELARLQAKSAREVEEGRNRSRMTDRRRPPETAADPRPPPATPANRLSDSNTNKTEEPTVASRPDADCFAVFQAAFPKRSGAQPWQRARRAINGRIAEGHTWREIVEGAQRYAAWCRETGKLGTEHVMQAATFVGPDKHFLNEFKVAVVDQAAAEKAAKRRADVDELAKILRLTRNHDESQESFDARVLAANDRRLKKLGHAA